MAVVVVVVEVVEVVRAARAPRHDVTWCVFFPLVSSAHFSLLAL